jgi:branched-chain amino acid transport system ATP-binding protein
MMDRLEGAADRSSDSGSGVPALELVDLYAGYGKTAILHGICMRIEQSSVTAVLGANGAGKTTLLRAAAGTLRFNSGSIRIHGRESRSMPAHKRVAAGLCLIPEGRGVFRALTVRENLLLAIPPWRREQTYAAAIDAFPVLGTRLNQLAGQLSGGEQQMLALGRAYVSEPTVLMADELSLGLAPLLVDEIFASLTALARRGTSLVVVEQYAQQVLDLADNVYILSRGEVSWNGRADELDRKELLASYLSESGESKSAKPK